MNVEQIKNEAKDEIAGEVHAQLKGELKTIQRNIFATKKLLKQYQMEADHVSEKVEGELDILETC